MCIYQHMVVFEGMNTGIISIRDGCSSIVCSLQNNISCVTIITTITTIYVANLLRKEIIPLLLLS